MGKGGRSGSVTGGEGSAAPRIALAVQGSFGHVVYAAGILDAFRELNQRRRAGRSGGPAHGGLHFGLASGCVEMMTPLWRYLAAQDADESLRAAFVDDDHSVPWWVQSRIAPAFARPDAVESYLSGLVAAQKRLTVATAGLFRFPPAGPGPADRLPPAGRGADGVAEFSGALQDALAYASGVPGQMAFNPLFMADKAPELEALCRVDHGPTIFTNATRARDFGEVYLYTGRDPDPEARRRMERGGRRRLLRLTPEYFFASGARPPYILPVPVKVDGRTEYWMEGAMRCNPPLNPLIDMGATHVVLLRFFCKDAREEPNNNAELNGRFIDAVFNIPLQKEIESIALNNCIARAIAGMDARSGAACGLPARRVVEVFDPADSHPDNPAHCAAYASFLEDELGLLSHFDGANASRRGQMFARGVEIGRELVRHLQAVLPA